MLMVALVVMLVVGVLAAQGMRMMRLSDTGLRQRVKQAQLHELLELGRMRLTEHAQAETISVEVPATAGIPARTAQLKIEQVSDPQAEIAAKWRIVVRYPFNESSETTVTWEERDERPGTTK